MFRGLTIKALAALACSIPIASANSGFYASCSYLQLEGVEGEILTARCTQTNGNQALPQLDLNICLANVNGNFVHTAYGDAFASCTDCRLGLSSIFCTCETASKGENYNANYDLNAIVGNVNGALCCFNYCGPFE